MTSETPFHNEAVSAAKGKTFLRVKRRRSRSPVEALRVLSGSSSAKKCKVDFNFAGTVEGADDPQELKAFLASPAIRERSSVKSRSGRDVSEIRSRCRAR